MDLQVVIMLAVSVLMLAYLTYAMLKPENF